MNDKQLLEFFAALTWSRLELDQKRDILEFVFSIITLPEDKRAEIQPYIDSCIKADRPQHRVDAFYAFWTRMADFEINGHISFLEARNQAAIVATESFSDVLQALKLPPQREEQTST